MSIYENPKEYAEQCHISLDLAKRRCEHYIKRIELTEKVVCPECGSRELCIDNDGSEDFIGCTGCWNTYDIDDERLKNWVKMQCGFDEVLRYSKDISKYGIEEVERNIGQKWEEFVKASTDALVTS